MTRRTRKSRINGFTLMELLVVIVILGVLIVAGISSFVSSQKKSRDSKRKNDLRQMGLAMETYYNDFGHYPLSDLNGNIKGCGSGGAAQCTWGQIWSNVSTTPETIYMLALPTDPTPGKVYYYVSDATGSYYKFYAYLENNLDTGTGVKQTGYLGTNCGGGTLCTYGAASTNTAP